jgi:MATE family multidrug resistance protein
MQPKITYKYILQLAAPIIVGSAVQNIIALTDQFFLGRIGETETGAIGYVGVFYLIITSIGYGFSKGGQIMIARLVGQRREFEIGKVTYGMFAFLAVLSVFFFVLVKLFAPWFFRQMTKDEAVYQSCMAFLDYRIYGVFFSYFGVAALALYTGVERTTAVIYNAIALLIVNILLNYGLVWGRLGMPAMGMAGSGLASTLAEAFASMIFLGYMFLDRHKLRAYGFWGKPGGAVGAEPAVAEDGALPEMEKSVRLTPIQLLRMELHVIIEQFKLSVPIVLQAAVGLGSWFVFFSAVGSLEPPALAVSSVLRAAYLILMIPSWGLNSATNTIVSRLIGQNDREHVMPALRKIALLSFLLSIGLALLTIYLPMLFKIELPGADTPQQVSLFLLGTDMGTVIAEANDLAWILMVALALYSVSSIYFNGMAGTGATKVGLYLQMGCVAAYLIYVYVAIWTLKMGVGAAWMSEFLYWILLFVGAIWYLHSKKWHHIEVAERPNFGQPHL